MFRADSLLAYLLLALSVTGSLGSPAAPAQPGTVSLPVKAPVSRAAKMKRDAAASRDSEQSVYKRQSPTITNLANDLTGYTAQVGIGSPATEYNLLLDTAHPNTWVGAGQAYRRTSTSVNKGTRVSVTYAQGSFSGTAFTDTVTLSTTDSVTLQTVDVASTSSGFTGFDGVLGLAPGSSALPTVLDNLYSQGKISTKEFGLGLQPNYPSWWSEAPSYGVLTFGGVDATRYIGPLDYTARVVGTPDTFWGVSVGVSFGSTYLATEVAATIDSLSPYVFLPQEIYNSYYASTGAILDDATGLLKIPTTATVPQPIEILWGANGGIYSITADAQIWPSWANADIGGDSDHYYLLIKNGGQAVTLGLPFIERYYLAFNVDTSSVGIAPTSYTHDAISWPSVAPYQQCAGDGWSGPAGACTTTSYVCFEIDSHDSRCLPIPVIQPNEQCAGPGFDWEGPDGVCTDGYTCQYVYDDASFCVPVGGY